MAYHVVLTVGFPYRRDRLINVSKERRATEEHLVDNDVRICAAVRVQNVCDVHGVVASSTVDQYQIKTVPISENPSSQGNNTDISL